MLEGQTFCELADFASGGDAAAQGLHDPRLPRVYILGCALADDIAVPGQEERCLGLQIIGNGQLSEHLFEGPARVQILPVEAMQRYRDDTLSTHAEFAGSGCACPNMKIVMTRAGLLTG